VPAGALLPVAVALVAGPGCVTSSQGREMRRDILALQAQFDELRAEKDAVRQTLERAKSEIGALEASNKDATELLRRLGAQSGVQIDNLKVEFAKLRGEHEEMAHVIEQMKRDLGEVQKAASVPKAPPPLPEEAAALYQYGVDAYQKGELREAVRAFRAFVDRHPSDPYADNAQYLIGDCLFLQGKHVEAVADLQRVLELYADGEKVDDAYFRIGEALDALGKCRDAQVFYGEVKKRFPKSKRMDEVKAKLKEKCK